VSACGSGGNGNPTPSPQGSYDLQAAMAALVKSGLSANVNLSGTAIVNGTSNPFTGTGTLTLSPGVSGMFNGTMAQLQTESISGTVTVAGQSSPYGSSIVNAYEPAATAVAGDSQSTEFDVAQAPPVLHTRNYECRPPGLWPLLLMGTPCGSAVRPRTLEVLFCVGERHAW
jgi:hypothetical protein